MNDRSSGFDLFNELAHEFAERYRRGEHPPLSEYTSKYPELADEIREHERPQRSFVVVHALLRGNEAAGWGCQRVDPVEPVLNSGVLEAHREVNLLSRPPALRDTIWT